MKFKTIFMSTILSSIMLSGLVLIFIKPIIFLYIMAILFTSFCVISIWFMFYSFLGSKNKPKEEETKTEELKPIVEESKPTQESLIKTEPAPKSTKLNIIRDETLATQVIGKTEAEFPTKQNTSNNNWW